MCTICECTNFYRRSIKLLLRKLFICSIMMSSLHCTMTMPKKMQTHRYDPRTLVFFLFTIVTRRKCFMTECVYVLYDRKSSEGDACLCAVNGRKLNHTFSKAQAHNLSGKQTRIGQSKWNYTSKLLKSTCSLILNRSLRFSFPCKISHKIANKRIS